MLGLCHVVFPYVEDHKFYCEHWFTSRFFSKIREFGALLARQGVLDEGEDVFQLQHFEVDQALVDVMLAWAAGVPPVGADHWKPLVARRKKILEQLKSWNAPPALGPMPDTPSKTRRCKCYGASRPRRSPFGRAAPRRPETTRFRGLPRRRAWVEGIARVLRDVNEIGLMREGEILVCSVTAPSWGPVFGKIRAAVSDIGGTMSHAAIVAREYGMPAVVRHRPGNEPHSHRPAAAGRRRPRRRDLARLRIRAPKEFTVMYVRWFRDVGLDDRPTVGGQGSESSVSSRGRA